MHILVTTFISWKMNSKFYVVCSVGLALFTTVTLSAQKSDFNGDWTLNKDKTVMADHQMFLSKITIHLKADSLLTTRTYENENGEEYPFDENVSLDGNDCKMSVYEMPRTTKANLTGGLISVESKTIFNGENGADSLLAKEAWKVRNDTLIIDFNNKMAAGEVSGTSYYNRAK